MKKDYYVYMYYDINEEINLESDLITFNYKPVYIGKGKGNRYNHSSKFSEISNIKVVKIFENLTEKQSYFIESYLIDFIGIEKLQNKKSGTHLYLLEHLEDNDIHEYIKILGAY